MKMNHQWIWQSKRWPDFTHKAPDTTLAYHHFGQLTMVETLLSPLLTQELVALALEDEAVATSLIEGEVLQRSSVRASVYRALHIEGEETAHSTVQTDALIDVLLDAKNGLAPLTHERLLGWHRALFPTGQSGLRTIRVGMYRNDEKGEMKIVSGPWGREKVHYIAPPAYLVEGEMNRFLLWLNTEKNLNVVIKSAVAHLWFLLIHPFDDGNGRLARAISDYVLSASEKVPSTLFSVASEINNRRKEYYGELDKVCVRGDVDISAWIAWFVNMLCAALDHALGKIEAVKIKALFWDKVRNVTINERQRKVIAKMLNRLPEPFEGGMRTAKYAAIAKTSKPTATRDLNDLVQKGILKSQGAGRGVYYTLT
ncbi:MAG: Fic family protein [Desulfobulbaceae bacterium]|uniref:Fic family protein n=1 Tax=Candidatus Desulfatifera sulfidica TaxID=2841691 RepID=A0A8J6N7B9_9BACT|nr:Fic family protein [Candidatus Desulfatifera sulfidica]